MSSVRIVTGLAAVVTGLALAIPSAFLSLSAATDDPAESRPGPRR